MTVTSIQRGELGENIVIIYLFFTFSGLRKNKK